MSWEVRSVRRDASSGRRFVVFLWALGPSITLPTILLLVVGIPELARETMLGSPGTQIALGALLVVTVMGAAVGMRTRMAPATAGRVVIVAAALAIGLAFMLIIAFAAAGHHLVLSVLLAHSALALGMIARSIQRTSTW
jgi:hypothetical protein